MKKAILGCSLLAVALLTGCGGSASSPANGGNAINTAQVSIAAMTSVPVVNGSATQGTLYVHNYGNNLVSEVSFNLGSATTKTKVKTVLAKVGLNLGGYEDANGLVLINPERCMSIPAGGSCSVNFTTPSLSVGNLGNSLVKLSYTSGNSSMITSQVVNYQYVNLNGLSGVNFTGSLKVTGAQGSTQHVVAYVYAGGASGTSYKNVNLNSTNATTTISNGFINGQEVVAGQVIAVEFAVAMQSNKTSFVNVTPNWGSSKLQSSLLSSSNSGSPLTLSLTPTQNTVNLIFGNIPVLSAPTTTSALINVVNNGNTDSSGGLTATATGAAASDLIIDYTDCSSKVLVANAVNSCQITFSTTSYASGTTTVDYKDSAGVVVGSQTVVWTNTKPFPAIYIAPTPTTISLGKGTSTGASSIVFMLTNVGQAPLTNVTYPVTNTGSATWTQDSSTCTATLGALASCSISGHLTGTDDGAGDLYVKAVGSFNNVNYSFVALPLDYTVSSIPSLQITPASMSMTLLANGVDSQSQTYVVTNIGNDSALFTGLALNDSSTNVIKPVISGDGDCTSSTTLAEGNQCTVIVTYGPAAANLTANESGLATLNIAYHGGTPDISKNAQATLNYNLVGNDSYVTESSTVTNLAGAGTQVSPYAGNANLDPMKITLTYSNPSLNYPMSNFNLNTNSLPYGLTVDPSSSCATGATLITLESNGATCNLVLALDRELLASVGGSVVLDFTTPTATWSTPLGFYSQAGTQTYLTYAQPSVVFTLAQNNANFESTVLSITGSNLDQGASQLSISVAGVKNWLESSPINPSSNCTVNPSTYAVSCTLTSASNIESVTYIMPNYLQPGESASIPLVFSTTGYGYLNPSYSFINYLFLPNFQAVGSAGFSNGAVTFTSLALNSSGTPYVAYIDSDNEEKATLMKYDGSSWVTVGSAGFSAGAVDYTNLALNSSGTPYVAYRDGSTEEFKVTVMKYNGSSWVTVGNAGFSAGQSDDVSLALESSGTPYVAYVDDGNEAKATVMKYDGNSWVTVGNPGFSAGVVAYTSLALDSSGTPYVAYKDDGNGSKATVMKYDGCSWVAVGNTGFSAGVVAFTSLALDSSGTPYVAYADGSNGSKATVMKYNGSSWVAVGNPGFSAGVISFTSLALDSSGTPYVAYADGSNGSKATIMKYDGSSWVVVGSAGFSAGTADYTSLALNSSGIPYVAYRDGGNAYKATVMSYPY